ncbi:MAG: hypothetical protein GKR90_14325 [Pseudomonadales bacterium]|nr:hypothetical protein [Pseudomonadales bacterium]
MALRTGFEFGWFLAMRSSYLFTSVLFLLALSACFDGEEQSWTPKQIHHSDSFTYTTIGDVSSDLMDRIAKELHENRDRIVGDLRIEEMPPAKVRVWAEQKPFADAFGGIWPVPWRTSTLRIGR